VPPECFAFCEWFWIAASQDHYSARVAVGSALQFPIQET